jgi:hypothetical protein
MPTKCQVINFESKMSVLRLRVDVESKMSVLRLRVDGESMILKWPEGSGMSKCELGLSGSE